MRGMPAGNSISWIPDASYNSKIIVKPCAGNLTHGLKRVVRNGLALASTALTSTNARS